MYHPCIPSHLLPVALLALCACSSGGDESEFSPTSSPTDEGTSCDTDAPGNDDPPPGDDDTTGDDDSTLEDDDLTGDAPPPGDDDTTGDDDSTLEDDDLTDDDPSPGDDDTTADDDSTLEDDDDATGDDDASEPAELEFLYEHVLGTGDYVVDEGTTLLVNCCDVAAINDDGLIHHVCSVKRDEYNMQFDQISDGGIYHPLGIYDPATSFRSFRREDTVPGEDVDVTMLESVLTFGQPAVSKTSGNLFLAMPYADVAAPSEEIGQGLFYYDYGARAFRNLFDTGGPASFLTQDREAIEVQWLDIDGVHVSVDEIDGEDICVFQASYSRPPSALMESAIFQVDSTGQVIRLFGSSDGIEVPGHSGALFTSFSQPWLRDRAVAAVGTWEGYEGVCLYDLERRSFQIVADTGDVFRAFNTQAPVGIAFSNLVMNGERKIAFVADFAEDRQGVFIADPSRGDSYGLVMGSGETETENRSVVAEQFHSLAFNEAGQLAFVARTSGESGIVFYDGSQRLYVVYYSGDTVLSPEGARNQGGAVLSNYGLSNPDPAVGEIIILFRYTYTKQTVYDDVDVTLHSGIARARARPVVVSSRARQDSSSNPRK